MAKRVKQRNQSDCVIAAIANALGKPYVHVRQMWVDSIRGGLHIDEIKWLASQFPEIDWRYTRPRKPVVLAEWLKRHKKGRYVVIMDVFLEGHAIAVVDGEAIGEWNEGWRVCGYFRFIEET